MSTKATAAKFAMARKEAVVVEQPVVAPIITGPEIPIAIHTKWATVVVYGHEHVSKKTIEILAACLTMESMDRDHGVRVVRFRADGRPITAAGSTVFANCTPDLGGMTINLMHHFTKAVELAMDDEERSIYAGWHILLMRSYLHEIAHLSPRVNVIDREQMDKALVEEGGKEAEEEHAEAFAAEMSYVLAKTVDIEPDHWGNESFFAKQINEFLKGDEKWQADQRHMLENRIFYKLEPEEGVHLGLEINTLKGFLHIESGDDPEAAEWNMVTAPSSLTTAIQEIATGPLATQPTTVNLNTMVGSSYSAEEMDHFEGPGMDEYDGEYYSQPAGMAGAAPGFVGVNVPAPAAPPISSFATAPPSDPMAGKPRPDVFPRTHLAPAATGQIVMGVYGKIYDHIFNHCQRQLNSDMGFARPEAVSEMPIMLTAAELPVVVKCDCLGADGRWSSNMPTSNGQLRGFIMKNSKLPAYKLYINNDGQESVRLILPQNPAKVNSDGSYKETALAARGGTCILYIMEGNDDVAKATGKKFVAKIVDGQYIPC